MNKKSFIKKLKKNLSILEENEVNDIVEEYSDNIDEKIKNGKTEEEAIKDFGDVDELSKEILKAYKINPKNIIEDDSDTLHNLEKFIDKSAKKLSNFASNLINDIKQKDNITLEFICEMIIKIIILLIICAVLGLPFWGLLGLGHAIFDIAFFPLDVVLNVVWGLLVWILYFVVCILIGFALFKDNIKNTKEEKSKSKKTSKKSTKEEIKTESITEEKSKKKEVNNKSYLVSIIKTIIKIFIFLFFLFPIVFIIVGLIFAIVAVIYYLIIGINLWGILLILISLTILFSFVFCVLKNIFTNKKTVIYPFFIGIILLAIGTFVTFDTFKNIELVTLDEYDIKTLNFSVDKSTILKLRGNYEVVFDEKMTDGQISVVVYYYDDYANIETWSNQNKIEIFPIYEVQNGWNLYDEIIANLKDDKFMNYEKLQEFNYKIYGNKKTINIIDIDNF